MSSADLDSRVELLEREIAACELQLRRLKLDLAQARNEQLRITVHDHDRANDLSLALDGGFPEGWISETLAVLREQNVEQHSKWPLLDKEYRRYGRQLIMPEIGLEGQLRLKQTSVLVVGVGGLGCPAAAYLAGAGVKALGLVDADYVEESNLHRQILHNTEKVGVSKVDSAVDYLISLNPNVKYLTHRTRLTPENAFEIVKDYDIVLDCTDTPASRYLISDVCVLLNKPLVSASALRTEGQLMTLNFPPRPPGDSSGGPCYRCIFPKPPPPESVISCGDGGILGPVVGVMGVLQALETIKLITKDLQQRRPFDPSGSNTFASGVYSPTLLLFSAFGEPQFRSIKMRTRKVTCAACSSKTAAESIMNGLQSGSLDYSQFCGLISPVNALEPSERVSAKDFADLRPSFDNGTGYVLVDVRDKVQFGLCCLDNSINIPISEFSGGLVEAATDKPPVWASHFDNQENRKPIFVVCRYGNDSQFAVRKMKDAGLDLGGGRYVGDIVGGLKAWRKEVDPSFPEY